MITTFQLSIIRALVALFFYLILIGQGYAQNQGIADSLILIYDNKTFKEYEEYRLLNSILENETNPSRALIYASHLINKSNKENNLDSLFLGYIHRGNAQSHAGNIKNAVEDYYKSLDIAQMLNHDKLISYSYGSLANIYSANEDRNNALIFYKKTLNLAQKSRDTITLSLTYFNLANQYYHLKLPDSSKLMLEQSESFLKLSNDLGLQEMLGAYILGLRILNRASINIYEEIGADFDRLFTQLNKIGDLYGLSEYMIMLSAIYAEKFEYDKAILIAVEAKNLCELNGLHTRAMEANRQLAILFEDLNQLDTAFGYLKSYYSYRDTLLSNETTQKIANLRTEFEVGQKQAELDIVTAEKKTQRIILISVAVLALVLVILAIVIYQFYQSKAKVNRLLEGQKLLLEQQKQELESLNATKDKFFSIISHDLRGPVASFFGISRMIKFFVESKDTDQLLEVADNIDQSVERLSSLLDNLLSWAMQQQGQVPYHPEKLDLKEIAREQVGTFLNMASGKDVTLKSDVEEGLMFMADKNMIQTILRNLANNALKFTPKGGEVTITGKRDESMVLVQISDTGVGMPQDKLINLFRLQDKKSTYGTAGEKGLGLGLQLVHEFIEINDGKIEVTSEEGKGTTFSIWLPVI